MEQHSEDEVDLGLDISGERALCGSFNEEEELDYNEYVREENGSGLEDGEVTSGSENEDSDEEEIQQCIKDCDISKLKKLVKKREDDCRQLEREVLREWQKEKQKKEMSHLLDQLNKVSKTKRTLQCSLASSRQSSPASSPTPAKRITAPKGKQTKSEHKTKASSQPINEN